MFFISSLGLYGQVGEDTTYLLQREHWTIDDGLSHNSVTSFYEDSRRLVWLTTRFGVNRFDGRHFRNYTREQNGLHSSVIEQVYEAPDRLIWMLTGVDAFIGLRVRDNFGFSIFDPFEESVLDAEKVLGERLAAEIGSSKVYTQLPGGDLLFVSDGRQAIRYQGGRNYSTISLPRMATPITRVLPLDTFLIKITYADATGDPNGPTRLLDLRAQRFLDVDLDANLSSIDPVSPWRTGRPGVVYQNRHVGAAGHPALIETTRRGARLTYLTQLLPNRLATPEATIAHISRQTGNLLVNHQDSTFLINPRGNILGRYPSLFNRATVYFEDSSGNLYYSTQQDGFSRLTFAPNYFRRLGYAGISHRAFATGQGGQQWLSIDHVAYMYNGGRPPEGSSYYLSHNAALLRDKAGNIWAGPPVLNYHVKHIRKEVLYRYAGGDTTEVTTFATEQPHDANVWAIWEHPVDGSIWSATLAPAIYRTNPASGQTKTLLDERYAIFGQHEMVYGFTRGPAGSIWVSTSNGLLQLNDAGDLQARYAADEPGRLHLPATDIHHTYIDAEGQFWLSSGDAGLIRWHPNRPKNLRQYTQADGLPSMVVHAAYGDEHGNLWLATEEGIARFNKRTETVLVYGPEEGTSDTEYNRISHYQHPDGTLYFGGLTGITAFHPASIEAAQTPPPDGRYLIPLDVRQLSPDGDRIVNSVGTLERANTIYLPPESDRAEIAFHPQPGGSRAAVTLRYELEGSRPQSGLIQDGRLVLDNLSYGEHRLRVTALSSSGEVIDRAAYDVVVSKPYYLRHWFLLLCVLTVAGITYALAYARSQRLQRLIEERTEQIERDKFLIERQANELRELDRTKSRFFTNVSHELRTPLTLILAPINRLLNNRNLSADEFRHLLRASTNGDRLLRLVNDILNLAKLEQGGLKVVLVPTNAHQFLTRVVANFESLATQNNCQLATDLQLNSEAVFMIDRAKTESIVHNLVSNAVRHSAHASVTVYANYTDDELQLRIADSGQGIAVEDLPKIFDRFYQADSNLGRSTGGTGIGLAICKEFTELLGGQIAVSSTLGVGTEFTLRLPAKAADREGMVAQHGEDEELAGPQVQSFGEEQRITSQAGSSNEQAKGTSVEAPAQRPRVLIVEDNGDMQTYLSDVLSTNYEVATVSNGRQALNHLRSATEFTRLPQLIITDLMMPQMDGFELLTNLKATPEYANIPTIVLSARSSLQARLTALRTGIDDYLTKPFNEAELRQRITNVLTNAANRATPAPVLAPELTARYTDGAGADNTHPRPATTEAQPGTDPQSYAEEQTWLREVEAVVQENLEQEDFGNDDLAARFFVSSRTLSRKIKALTGLTVNKFMLEIRLTEARRLLEERPQSTLQEVAQSVGYQKASYFSRKFKERFGVLPSEYKER